MREKDDVSALGDAMAFVSGDTSLPPDHLRDVFGAYMGIVNAEQAEAFVARLDDPVFAEQIKQSADRVHPGITGDMLPEQVVAHIKILMLRAFEESTGATQPSLL